MARLLPQALSHLPARWRGKFFLAATTVSIPHRSLPAGSLLRHMRPHKLANDAFFLLGILRALEASACVSNARAVGFYSLHV